MQMDGKALAEQVRAQVAREVDSLGSVGIATVLVGDDPASHLYIGMKHKAAEQAGMRALDHRLPPETSQEELLSFVAELNGDDGVDGVLVQLPLPDHIDDATVVSAIRPMKDVDGLHPFNAGALFLGRPTLVGATPLGCLALLMEYKVPLEGRRAVVVGRSDIVGKPVAQLLLQANATVTMCHSRTQDLERHTLDADVLVVAAGSPGLVAADMVKTGSAVIDVGQNATDSGLVGDVDPGAAERAHWITPVPGGVGPMTIAMLLQNTVRAARYRRGELPFPG
jgi:methylenetetrahydrofolate dehydrogenase (NADP+)/methenyltetrahydrofolate cyclohydrolase